MTQRLLTYGTMVQDLPMGGQFAVNADTTTGLTFGFRAGTHIAADVRTAVSAGTVTLTDDATNWVHFSGATVAVNGGANPTRGGVLYKVTTASGVTTAIVDYRGCIVTEETAF